MKILERQRTRPVGVGQWRTFAAVARNLNFGASAEKLALTQSAVSRQIQALEEELGAALFVRHTRSVELTAAGALLYGMVPAMLDRLDDAVLQIRRGAGRKSVVISTWASFASMWLIKRMEDFQETHPDIDIRIDTSDSLVNLDTGDFDLVLRYATAERIGPMEATRLFDEQLTVVASPWLLKGKPPIRSAEDLLRFTLIELSDSHRPQHVDLLGWQRWFRQQGIAVVDPKRRLYFSYVHQIAQAALSGQGIALARVPLIADSLASGELIEVLPATRLETPFAYWLLVSARSAQRPEIKAFCDWLDSRAQATRICMA